MHSESMGQTASRASRPKGIVVTLDALGTLYRFKRPVADQYLDIARKAGLRSDIQADQLMKAFKTAYKTQIADYPNYGLGKLENPEEWWRKLVHATFGQVVAEEIPTNLGKQLYDHFSSTEAYQIYDDVHPFLRSMHHLRSQFSDPNGPAVLTGIITNSDSRVKQVLAQMSLNVGEVEVPSREAIRETAAISASTGRFETPWSDAYNPTRDFDFLVTGYESGVEKPSPGIWKHADFQASLVAVSKAEKGMELPGGKVRSAFAVVSNALSHIGKTENMKWIHIGDEYEKDYLGAKAAGREALLLDRDGTMDVQADRVTNLEEAAVVINLMAQELMTEDAP